MVVSVGECMQETFCGSSGAGFSSCLGASTSDDGLAIAMLLWTSEGFSSGEVGGDEETKAN
jgi:hypothetical protein